MKSNQVRLHVFFAALFAIVATLIAAALTNQWEHVFISSVGVSSFIVGLLTPMCSDLLSQAKPKQALQASHSAKTQPQAVSADAEAYSLYVGNIAFRLNHHTVKEFFEQYSPVKSVRIVKDRRTGRSKGYGFVEVFADDIEYVIEQTNNAEVGGREIKVRLAHSEQEQD